MRYAVETHLIRRVLNTHLILYSIQTAYAQGKLALANAPHVEQLVLQSGSLTGDELEKALYGVQRSVQTSVRARIRIRIRIRLRLRVCIRRSTESSAHCAKFGTYHISVHG
jgi:hypothetical protein